MEVIYGIDCPTPDNTVSFSPVLRSWHCSEIRKYIKVAEETLENITHAVIPGSFMVDIIPWCAYFVIFPDYCTDFDFVTVKYLPYIGLPFQKHAREGQKQVKLMVERPFKHVHRERVS